MKIRRATRDDEDLFVTIYKSAYSDMERYAYKKDREIKRYFRWLFKRDPEGLFFALNENNLPVAIIACDSTWFSSYEYTQVGEIHELAVMKNYQGRGIGRKLMITGEKYFIKKELKKAELWVGEENRRAIKFYLSLGYTPREKAWGDWIRMVKSLI